MKDNQTGQIIIVMLLTMLVALSVGLVVTQRSITDVTTSTQTEQASRAFSAAEAGIERAISLGDAAIGTTLAPIKEEELGNQASTSEVKASSDLPTTMDEALEYPPINKESVAHFWLSDPKTLASFYTAPTIELYFGNKDQTPPLPAVEVNIITNDNGVYRSNKRYYDSDPARAGNGFITVTSSGSGVSAPKTFDPLTFTIKSSDFAFRVSGIPIADTPCTLALGCYPVLARVRILYSSTNQKVALGPAPSSRLPGQANVYSSIGRSGLSEKKVVHFRQRLVPPVFLDFAIFSLGNISK